MFTKFSEITQCKPL